jgi:hypothetical protein
MVISLQPQRKRKMSIKVILMGTDHAGQPNTMKLHEINFNTTQHYGQHKLNNAIPDSFFMTLVSTDTQ